jgi:hypothetical protein
MRGIPGGLDSGVQGRERQRVVIMTDLPRFDPAYVCQQRNVICVHAPPPPFTLVPFGFDEAGSLS